MLSLLTATLIALSLYTICFVADALLGPVLALQFGLIFIFGTVTMDLRSRGRQPDSGLCPACGYDLRGTPGSSDSGGGGKTCPECGAACSSVEGKRDTSPA